MQWHYYLFIMYCPQGWVNDRKILFVTFATFPTVATVVNVAGCFMAFRPVQRVQLSKYIN